MRDPRRGGATIVGVEQPLRFSSKLFHGSITKPLALPRLPLAKCQHFEVCDAQDPTGEVGSRRKFVGVLPNVEIDVLGDLFGIGPLRNQ